MGNVRNDEVISAFEIGLPATNHRKSLSTDGKKLYSYRLCIADTCPITGKKILREYTAGGKWGFQSQTTSCHVGLARRVADMVV